VLILPLLVLGNTIDFKKEDGFLNYGTLYGLSANVFQLASIDPNTAKVTSFGQSHSNLVVSSQLTAIDTLNQIFYAVFCHYNSL
jgi:hypothetical protein